MFPPLKITASTPANPQWVRKDAEQNTNWQKNQKIKCSQNNLCLKITDSLGD